MVRCDDNDRIVRFPCFFQSFHQIGQTFFQFLVRGKIAPDRVGVAQILHDLPVAFRHCVGVQAVVGMAADGHVIDVEMILVDIHGKRIAEHILIAFRPAERTALFHAVPPSHPVLVPEPPVGLMPVVIGVFAVVIPGGIIPFLLQLVPEGEPEIMAHDAGHRTHRFHGDDPREE